MTRRFEWAWAAVAIVVAGAAGLSCSATSGEATSEIGGGHSTNGAGNGNGSFSAGNGGSGGGISVGNGSGSGSGTGGGVVQHHTSCDGSCATAGGTCNQGVCEITENPGSVDQGTKNSLVGGGAADASFKFLYPYDKTVFPRGLIAPTLQFAGIAPDAIYVHVTSPGMNYQGFYAGSNPARVQFSDAVWKAITLAAFGGENVKVDVSKITSGAVSGPVTDTWQIAQGSVRGTIYYETYGSPLAGGPESVGIMEIQPGATVPTVLKKSSGIEGCAAICHTASADGSTLVTANGLMSSDSWDLSNNASLIKSAGLAGGNKFTYGGIYPDGSFEVSATHYRTWEASPSRLYDTHTGANIATPSWDNTINHGGTVAFSPDGKFIGFNHEDQGGGHSLAVMNYDHASNVFSGLTNIAENSGRTLGWPAFTPDSKWVAFHAGTNEQFETDGGAQGDLYVTDLATHTVTRLDAADGYDATGNYLPANDPDLSFAPTILPEAVGGYFWMVFTSHRSYGNTLPTQDNGDQNGKLWVAALDINGTAGQDLSHPAFYLDGQEKAADNLRGFWVVDPCMGDGKDCTSGDQCCGGYCRPNTNATADVCTSMTSGCSNDYEKCNTAGDCCNSGDECINNRCAAPAPPK